MLLYARIKDETVYASIDNVSKGQKVKIELSADASFEKIEPNVDYFEAE